jgi:hypothetical protein
MSIESVMKLAHEGMVPRKRAIAKIHFTDFIEMFESDHEALIKSVENGDFNKDAVVKMLKAQLDTYATKIMKEAEEQMIVDSTKKPQTSQNLLRYKNVSTGKKNKVINDTNHTKNVSINKHYNLLETK